MRLCRHWAVWAVAAGSTLLAACGRSEPVIDAPVVLATLQAAYPGAQIDTVKASPLNGLFEVSLAGRTIYSDSSGRYLLMGSLHDMQAAPGTSPLDASSTANAAPALGAAQLQRLERAAAKDALKMVKGSGQHRLYVFSDPQCPYCRTLEAEFDHLQDVTVHTFIFPVLSAQSRPIASRVWCAKDRLAQWKVVMSGGNAAAGQSCDTPWDRNIELGRALGVRGTPTIINESGQIMTGMRNAPAIAQFATLTGEKK
jgi:thiol:disulfide interchange protein DsbC